MLTKKIHDLKGAKKGLKGILEKEKGIDNPESASMNKFRKKREC